MNLKISQFIGRFSSFAYLNITQFLGAMNDNVYKLLIIFFLIQIKGIERSPVVLATTGAIYVLPFIFFSSTAGILADRYSKSRIIVFTKAFELVIMALGILSFASKSQLGAYGTLFLLATHSSLFSPSKYGILPELMPSENISRANGLMTSFTYLAIILGTFFASFLVDMTGRNFILSSMFCLCTSFIGLLASLCIQRTPPSGSRKKLEVHFISDIYKTLKRVRKEPSLLASVLGSASFLFLGAFVQLNMIPFAVQSLNLSDVQGGYLFLLTAIGIGSGSLIAGKISGKRVELALVPLAGLGITASFFLLDHFSSNLYAVLPLVVIVGVFGGMYLIPLDSYVQVASPKQYIGQAVAATTFLSFVGVLFASFLLYLLAEVFGLSADTGFTILGCITSLITVAYAVLFFDYLTRFVGMILSRIHFRISFSGQEKIPEAPSLYVCTHTAWNDTLLLLGAQRRRMRFFIEHEQEHTPWCKRLYKMLRVVLVPEIEPLQNNLECITAIKKTLEKGISVCIFTENPNVANEFEKFKHAYFVQEILKDTHCPLIAVSIEIGEKGKKPRFFRRLLNKFRVPALIKFEEVSWEDRPHSEFYGDSSLATDKPYPTKFVLRQLEQEGFT